MSAGSLGFARARYTEKKFSIRYRNLTRNVRVSHTLSDNRSQVSDNSLETVKRLSTEFEE